MASTRQLKGRIRSVKNTKQITKAMQMVAASKMRRAQDATKASSDYTRSAQELLTHLAAQGATNGHPLFTDRPVKSRLLIVIAADKGLAGAYNTNVMKAYIQSLKSDDKEGVRNMTISVGRKASQFVSRIKDTEVIGTYNDLPDHPEGSEFYAILSTACDKFVEGTVDAVDVIFTRFVSSMTQTAEVQRILPAGFSAETVSEFVRDATYEPSVSVVLEGVARRMVGAQLFQALLDARASEHSMRMLAMKNATDNATELADDLTLEMNKARQAAITQELAEISGGAEAMNG
ncbi:ATP synthase F1 subunit gamma [Candidatus Saccharibacteria bacterium]|nr:ATP synthase F1 subunit gamma [Candidatus Saccharibacteria bacterium]